MARQGFSKSFLSNKNWFFIAGLVLLTVGLIFLFKQKDLISYVDKQKESIVDFYAQNLEPLFSNNRLTKEDIFNFAFYKELPMDKQNNQVLQLGNDSNGKEYFEFRKAEYNPKTSNLEQFAGLLDLNEKQKHQLDSILTMYRDKIQTQVLVNDRNTLAINSNLWNLNKALMANLLLFASKANKNKFKDVFPEEFYSANEPSISKMVSDARSFNNNKYIFVHSDTIFTKEFNFDKDKFAALKPRENQDPRVRIKLDNDLTSSGSKTSFKRNNFNIKVDSNYFRVQIPDIPETDMPDMDKVTTELEKAARQMKTLSIRFHTPIPPTPPVKSNRQRPNVPREPSGDFELNINIPNVDSIVHAAISGSALEISRHLKVNLDSLTAVLNTDSMMTAKDRQELKKEMQLLKKQLKELKKSNIQFNDNNSSDD